VSPEDLLERGLGVFEKSVENKPGTVWEKIRRSRAALLILALTTAFMQLRKLPESFSSTTMDAAAILQPAFPAKDVRLVAIDEQDYQTTFGGRSPLDPAKFSELLTDIARGQPSVVVVDFDTSHPMFQTMKAPLTAPFVWAVSNRHGGDPPFEAEKPLGGIPMPPNSTAALDLIPRDGRGIVRKYVRQFPDLHGGSIPSLEFAASQLYKGQPLPAVVNSTNNELLLDFRYRVPSYSAQEIRQRAPLPGWPRGVLNGKVVVLGGTFKEARDRHSTPVRLIDGAEIVAQATEAEIENTGVLPVSPWFAGFLQLVAGLGFIVLYRYVGLRTAFLASLILVPVLSAAASMILFHRLGLWAALIPILISLLVTELYSNAALYLALCKKFAGQSIPKTTAETQEIPVETEKKIGAAGSR